MNEHETCEQCHFNGAHFSDDDLLSALEGLGPSWREMMSTAGTDLRVRPAPPVWSTLEYAAHSRDITALHVVGVSEALKGTEPDFGDIDGDELIANAAANSANDEPEVVVSELTNECVALARVAREAGATSWHYGLTTGSTRSNVRQLLEHALHYSTHHLDDVERGLAQIHTHRAPS